MYRQRFGIPMGTSLVSRPRGGRGKAAWVRGYMGTDSASLLANLSCFCFYEYRCIMREKNVYMARRFINTMRYIDDLLVMNLIRRFRTYILLSFNYRKTQYIFLLRHTYNHGT